MTHIQKNGLKVDNFFPTEIQIKHLIIVTRTESSNFKMLNLTAWSYKYIIKNRNIDSGRNNFLCKDGFHVIMRVIKADVLQNDDELNLEINTCINNMPSKKKSIS